MAKLSLAQAWDEAAAFVKRQARLLFPLAFVLVAIPAAVAAALMPETQAGQLPPAGSWILASIASMLVGMVGQLALSYLALRGNASVGEAIARGFRRFPILLGAMLLIGLAVAAAAFFVILILVMLIPGLTNNPPDREAVATLFRILAILFTPVILYVGARFVALTPAVAAEPGGPIAMLRRSWSLSKGHVWQLIGFILLVGILVIVVSLAVAEVGGILAVIVAGEIRPGSLSSFIVLLIGAILQTVIAVYMATLIARVYVQLAAEPGSSAA